MKSIIFVSLLVAAIAIPLAEAQIVGSPLQLININGTVFCSANASVPGTILTPFPNATVALQCGGIVVSTATTTGTGNFSIVVNTNINVGLILSLLSGGCKLVVTTPLANCNVTLGALPGNLTSGLQLPSPSPIPGVPAIPAAPALIATIFSQLPIVLNLLASVFRLV